MGVENDRELVKLLLQDVPEMPFPEQYLNIAVKNSKKMDFPSLRHKRLFILLNFGM